MYIPGSSFKVPKKNKGGQGNKSEGSSLVISDLDDLLSRVDEDMGPDMPVVLDEDAQAIADSLHLGDNYRTAPVIAKGNQTAPIKPQGRGKRATIEVTRLEGLTPKSSSKNKVQDYNTLNPVSSNSHNKRDDSLSPRHNEEQNEGTRFDSVPSQAMTAHRLLGHAGAPQTVQIKKTLDNKARGKDELEMPRFRQSRADEERRPSIFYK